MTNDNFTEAAEVASWEDDRHPDDMGAWSRMKFMRGAEWARTHLAAQEPTDAEVRAVMKVARTHYSTPVGVGPSFARAVLDAARAARRDEETR